LKGRVLDQEERRQEIDVVLHRWFGDVVDYLGTNGPTDLAQTKQTRLAEAKRCETRLTAMSDNELARQRRYPYDDELEPEGTFYSLDGEPDFGFWGKLAHWKVEEAAVLLLGRDPNWVAPGHMEVLKSGSSSWMRFTRLIEMLRRAYEAGDLGEKLVRPTTILDWAEKHDVPCPDELAEVIQYHAACSESALPTAKRNIKLQKAANRLANQWRSEGKKFIKREICRALLDSPEFNQMFRTVETIEKLVHKEW